MKLGSLFDGIGGFPLAAIGHNIKPVWASEIEPFPVRVTEKHFPEMKHLGNITQINGAEVEPVDIITFGSPCQDLSIAGKGAGLEGERSSLFFEAIRIIKEMRDSTNGQSPRFAIWENVPGALSSNKGEDFKAVVQSFIEIGALDISWRIFDAQYFGVPQRRRRIFLVADFRGQRAGEILFEPEGLPWNFTEGRKKGEEAAGSVGESLEESSGCLTPWDVQSRRIYEKDGKWPALYGGEGGGRGYVAQSERVPTICFEPGAMSRLGGYSWEEKCSTLRAVMGDNQPCVLFEPRSQDGVPRIHKDICPTLNTSQGGQRQPCVVQKTYLLQGSMIGRADKNGPQGSGINKEISFTLKTTDRHAVAQCLATDIGEVLLPIITPLITKIGEIAAKFGAMSPDRTGCRYDPETETLPVVKVAYTSSSYGGYKDGVGTLRGSGGDLGGGSETLINDYVVRRLTPTECLRLQGFPDYWLSGLSVENPSKEDISFWLEVFETHRQALFPEKKPKTEKQIIAWLKKPYSDTAAYKAIGNSLAVPVVDWIFKRLREVVSWGLVDD